MSTPVRPSRAERAANTRTRLLEAAASAFGEQGYATTSVDEVAERAGLTKGAVYAHFRNKDDLLVSVLEWAVDLRLARLSSVLTDGPPLRQAQEGAAWFARFLEEDRRWTLLFFEFWLQAARDPAWRERYAAYLARARAGVTALINERARSGGIPLPMSAQHLSAAVLALASGLALEVLITPDVDASDVLAAVLTRLLTPNDQSGGMPT